MQVMEGVGCLRYNSRSSKLYCRRGCGTLAPVQYALRRPAEQYLCHVPTGPGDQAWHGQRAESCRSVSSLSPKVVKPGAVFHGAGGDHGDGFYRG